MAISSLPAMGTGISEVARRCHALRDAREVLEAPGQLAGEQPPSEGGQGADDQDGSGDPHPERIGDAVQVHQAAGHLDGSRAWVKGHGEQPELARLELHVAGRARRPVGPCRQCEVGGLDRDGQPSLAAHGDARAVEHLRPERGGAGRSVAVEIHAR